MSLPYPFQFWVVAEQTVNEVSLAIFNPAELNLHLVSDITYFCAERGR